MARQPSPSFGRRTGPAFGELVLPKNRDFEFEFFFRKILSFHVLLWQENICSKNVFLHAFQHKILNILSSFFFIFYFFYKSKLQSPTWEKYHYLKLKFNLIICKTHYFTFASRRRSALTDFENLVTLIIILNSLRSSRGYTGLPTSATGRAVPSRLAGR